MNTSSLRRIALATVIAFSFTLVSPAVQAGIIATDNALAGATADASRVRLTAALARADVREQLVANGVDPALVAERVAALTDAEANELAGRIDQMPAGGDVLGVLLTVFVVLLITDLLGWTHVFPFTNKGSVR